MSSVTISDDERVVWIEKDKDARLDYTLKLAALLDAGDTIASVQADAAPSGDLVCSVVSIAGSDVQLLLYGGTQQTWYAVTVRWTSLAGIVDEITLRVWVPQDKELVSSQGTALFPNRFTALRRLRADRLMLLARTLNKAAADVSDDYLWSKLLAAQSQIAHKLRVPLEVTQFFPNDPTLQDLAGLPAGMPWDIDPGYDYDPAFFHSERWGFMQLRQKPVASVSSVKILFPAAPGTTFFSVPNDWLKLDRKYGELQFVPISGSGGIPLNAFMLQALSVGRNVPFAIQVTYRAGLADVVRDYPELVDAVQKKAILKVVEDSFLPTSGSISGDGLSQSVSVDMEKYRDTIDSILDGMKGANGGLMAALHGVRMAVL